MPCYDGQSCSSYYSHGHGGTSTFNRHSLQGWELADVLTMADGDPVI